MASRPLGELGVFKSIFIFFIIIFLVIVNVC